MKLAGTAVVVMAGLAAVAAGGTLAARDVPAAVRATVKREGKGLGVRSARKVFLIEMAEDWETDEAVTLVVAEDGTLLRREPAEELELDEVPAAARAEILKATKGMHVEEIERWVERGETRYGVGAEEMWLAFSFDSKGKLLRIEGDVPFEKAPKAVRDAIRKRAPNAEIEELWRLTEDGETVYHGEFEDGEEMVGFEIDEKGNVLEWEEEEEDDDDGDDDDDDGEDEDGDDDDR